MGSDFPWEAGPQWQPRFAMRPQVMMYLGSTVIAQWGSENRLVLDEFLTDTNGAPSGPLGGPWGTANRQQKM